eukprot:scaffold51351_cov30-Tisochrysis_lutea.AAC.2
MDASDASASIAVECTIWSGQPACRRNRAMSQRRPSSAATLWRMSSSPRQAALAALTSLHIAPMPVRSALCTPVHCSRIGRSLRVDRSLASSPRGSSATRSTPPSAASAVSSMLTECLPFGVWTWNLSCPTRPLPRTIGSSIGPNQHRAAELDPPFPSSRLGATCCSSSLALILQSDIMKPSKTRSVMYAVGARTRRGRRSVAISLPRACAPSASSVTSARAGRR